MLEIIFGVYCAVIGEITTVSDKVSFVFIKLPLLIGGFALIIKGVVG